MRASRSHGVFDLAAELLVVFAGVVIALAADSWRETQQEQGRIRDNLETLAEDMVAARAAIDEALADDSASLANIESVRSELLSGDPGHSVDLDVGDIRISPVPLGTLRLLVGSGDVRLIEDAEVRSELIQGLARIELYQGWMDDLATDGRRAGEASTRAEYEARVAGRPWPESAYGNADVLTGLVLLASRIDNIVTLLGRTRTIVGDIEEATRAELGSS